jgi:hypothetical protein
MVFDKDQKALLLSTEYGKQDHQLGRKKNYNKELPQQKIIPIQRQKENLCYNLMLQSQERGKPMDTKRKIE